MSCHYSLLAYYELADLACRETCSRAGHCKYI